MHAKKNPAGGRGLFLKSACAARQLGRLDVHGRRTLRALFYIKRYLLAFGQAFEAAALNGRVMNKHIFTAVLRGNKAKAFSIVEPLYCSCRHGNTS